jgi:hypothetical protein
MPDPDASVRQRLFARLAGTLGPIGDPGGGSSGESAPTASAPVSAPPALTSSVIAVMLKPLPLALTAFGLGLASGVGLYAGLAKPEMAPESPSLPAPPIDRTAVEPPAVFLEPKVDTALNPVPPKLNPVPEAEERSRSSRRDDSPSSDDADLAEERAWIERARSALARTDPAGALEALEQHRREFARGRLSEERDALTIRALMQSGRGAQARELAARFRARYPRSIFLRFLP